MIFLPFIDLGALIQMPHELVLPVSKEGELAFEQVNPIDIEEEASLEKEILFESDIEVKSFVLEGSVENFDPAARAVELVKTLPRTWCGSYKPFNKDSKIEVRLTFSKVYSTGQIVDLEGEMLLGSVKTKINGHLNAKSDQMELIPLGSNLIAGLEPGGSFIGLQGAELFGWKSPRLNDQGGRLKLMKDCNQASLEAPAVRSVW